MPKKEDQGEKKETKERKESPVEEKAEIESAKESFEAKEGEEKEVKTPRIKTEEVREINEPQKTEGEMNSEELNQQTINPNEKEDEEDLFIEEEPSKLKKILSKKTLFIVLAVLLVAGLIAGGVYFYQKGMGKQKKVEKETVQTTESLPTQAPIETPSINEVKREDLKIQVLNGTGEPGAAGAGQKYLEGLGYQEIETANAQAYSYDQTEIAIKKDKEDYLNLLKEDLAKKYELAEEETSLEAESDYDVVITLGPEKETEAENKGEEATPEASETEE